MHDDRIGGTVRVFRSGQGAPLDAVLGEIERLLIRGLGQGIALQTHAQSRLVHHDKHDFEALVFLAHEPAGRLVIVHDTGGIAVNAHLVFQAAALGVVALAGIAVSIGDEFWNHEQGNALHTFRSAFDTGQDQVDDILGHVVLAGGDPDLLASDLVGTVRLRDRLGAQHAQIRSAMRFGQVHRAAPLTGDHLGQVQRLLLVRAARVQSCSRTQRQARIHAERHVGGGDHLVEGEVENVRQALATIFRIRGQRRPARFRHLLESLFPAGRRLDVSVFVTRTALDIPDLGDRRQNAFTEFRALFEDGTHRLGIRICETWKVGILAHIKNVVQDEHLVTYRGAISSHDLSPTISQCGVFAP